jgi:hypothetical protein
VRADLTNSNAPATGFRLPPTALSGPELSVLLLMCHATMFFWAEIEIDHFFEPILF